MAKNQPKWIMLPPSTNVGDKARVDCYKQALPVVQLMSTPNNREVISTRERGDKVKKGNCIKQEIKDCRSLYLQASSAEIIW